MRYHWLGAIIPALPARLARGPSLARSSSSIAAYTQSFPPPKTTPYYTTTMAFLNASLVGVSSARLAAARLAARTTPTSTLIARRLLSSSSAARAAHVDPSRPQHKDYLPEPSAPKSPSMSAAYPGEDTNPYHGGPSAIEKAVHLFFFTEIVRGACGHVFPLFLLSRTCL
jgi:hypothetical protein